LLLIFCCCAGDNFFTSLKLINYLSDKQFSYLGTVRLNKREMPNVLNIMNKEPRYTSRFYKDATGNVSLTVYKPKPNKVVAMLSSFFVHPTVADPQSEKKKPDVIEYYNSSKCGVDCFDAMSRMLTTRCASRRWPLYVLFNILDIAGINSWVLYKETMVETLSRRDFMMRLVEELIGIKDKLPTLKITSNIPSKRHRCQITQCQNKTLHRCNICEKFLCGVHIASQEVNLYCVECQP
jgi:hypothetical protein